MQQALFSETHRLSDLKRRSRGSGVERSRKQQQTVAINRGLFLIRYAATEDNDRPPKVLVSPDPPSSRHLRFVLHPDHDEAVLWRPDSCLVVLATRPGMLAVRVIPSQEGGSTAATIRIEPLSQGDPSLFAEVKRRNNASYDFADFCVLGHVSGMGDVLVNAGEWLAGPAAPSRIEGISLDWPSKPAELDIHYAVKTLKPQTSSGRTIVMGSFAGTRGKAMPVVGLMLEMSGARASDLQFSVEAIFLGAPVTRLTGKRIVATGPTGREPLVGLRINLERAHVIPVAKAMPESTKAGQPSSRVRVFRSRTNREQPVLA